MKSESPHTPQGSTVLVKRLRALNSNIKKQISFKRNFFLSIVSGIGYTIGATIVAGIVIAILSWTINSIEDVPVLNKLIDSTKLQQNFQQ